MNPKYFNNESDPYGISIRIFDFFFYSVEATKTSLSWCPWFFLHLSLFCVNTQLYEPHKERKEERRKPTTFIRRLRDSYNFSSNWLFWRKNLSSSWNVKKCISRFFEVLTSCLEQVRQSVLTENFKYFRAQKFLTKKAKMLIRNQDNPSFFSNCF